MILNNHSRALVEKLRNQGEFDAAALIEMLELGFARLSLSAATLFDEDAAFATECEENFQKMARSSTCPKVKALKNTAENTTENAAPLMAELFPHAADVPKRWSELKTLLFKECGNGN